MFNYTFREKNRAPSTFVIMNRFFDEILQKYFFLSSEYYSFINRNEIPPPQGSMPKLKSLKQN